MSYLTMAKENSLPYYLHIAGWNRWIHTFPKSISILWNANSLDKELNLGH